MFIFFFAEALFERYKFRCGHQTGVTVVFGVAFSMAMHFLTKDAHINVFKFSESIFFDFLLPPIIFNSGYNMRQKKFFQNIGNVSIFGIAVTFVCFSMYSAVTYILLQAEFFNMYNYSTGVTKIIKIDPLPLLLFTSLLCSSDVVAAVSIISYKEQPKLYSCIFGEGIFNDSVSIILFNAVESVINDEMTAATPFIVLG